MVTKFHETREWKLGDETQKSWARLLAGRGNVVLPIYGMDDVDPRTKAPVLFTDDDLLVAPDLLVLSPRAQSWHEVKAKAVPTWRRYPPGPRWEHGMDYDLLDEYKEVQERTKIVAFIVVYESASPADPNDDGRLSGPPQWLYASLQHVIDVGDRREDWPGGRSNPTNRGRRQRGGWLWGRSEMSVFSLHDRQ